MYQKWMKFINTTNYEWAHEFSATIYVQIFLNLNQF